MIFICAAADIEAHGRQAFRSQSGCHASLSTEELQKHAAFVLDSQRNGMLQL
jgi:hypothetical protein